MDPICLGILRETKIPPDKRVALTPVQCRELLDTYQGLKIVVQPSEYRCYTDEEYREAGLNLSEDLSACQVLMGVKEVKIHALLADKTYFFFSHTAKKQPYNRELLATLVERGNRMVDYEYLTGRDMQRVVAFGHWAGVVGAYNGLRALGISTGKFSLKPAHECYDQEELKQELEKVDPGSTRMLLSGGGRVAGGAVEILESAGISFKTPEEYLASDFEHAVYTRLDPWHYAKREDSSGFDFPHFMAHPDLYESSFLPFAKRTDLFIACHFWDPRSPLMLTRKDLLRSDVTISLIADISCDIDGPIASTIRASTIADPFYGYDPLTGKETEPFTGQGITVMAVDNLPGELPRDASADFGNALMEHVIPELLGLKNTGMLDRASITSGRALTEPYRYLQDYLDGKE
ncbi:MAG: NAD(P)-dependent oxidoreductase [Bacteroidota bacterium]